ncbi:hypothetical protein IQ07DRAFT_221644 [Pyrenochaeta sp. DS3sAY3a]|nr:hypothetical protein IQ07DRAFT_221644 [Pyrenochaeta sp. DS3sAY3a]
MATMRAGRGQEVLPELARARQELYQDFQNWLTFDPRHHYSLAQWMSGTSLSPRAGSSNSTDDERDSMASRSFPAYIINMDFELLRRMIILYDQHSVTHIQRRIHNAFNQARRLNELGDLRLHPMYRIAKGSNLFTATSRPIIKPSYRNSLQEMNIALAIEFLRLHEGGGMHILCVVQHSILTAQKFGNGFPTWVPEWEQPDIYCHIGLHAKRLTMFRPCGEIYGNMTITLTLPTIILAGIVVDTIASITEPIPADMIAHSEACLELWQTIVRISGPLHAVPDQQKLQSFCRLLTVDNFECATPSFHHQLQDNATLLNSFTTFWSDMNTHINSKSGPSPTSNKSSLSDDQQTNERRGNSFWKLALLVSRNRRVFSTTKGYLGIGPQILQEGDMVCIFPGVPAPLILRPREEHFLLVGESYVDGIMYGEEADESKVRQFDIR